MKRGQTETVGLLLIVILISFMMIFAMRSCSEPPKNYAGEYMRRDLASSVVGAILNSHSGCTDDTLMSKILIDCAGHVSSGGSDEIICTGGQRTCQYASLVLQEMLDGTLGRWTGIEYEFRVQSPDNAEISGLTIRSPDARARQDIDPFIQPLPVDNSGRTMTIILCIGGRCS